MNKAHRQVLAPFCRLFGETREINEEDFSGIPTLSSRLINCPPETLRAAPPPRVHVMLAAAHLFMSRQPATGFCDGF